VVATLALLLVLAACGRAPLQKRETPESVSGMRVETVQMALLPDEQREIIVLHLQSKLPFREIATLREISINTAMSRYRYGLEKMRSALDGELEP